MSEQSVLLPPVDSDPAYNALLEANVNARQALQDAQAVMNPSAMTAAEQLLDDVSGDIVKYELRRAADLMRGLRFAQRHNPEALRAALNEAAGIDVRRDDIRELRSDVDEVIEKLADTIAIPLRAKQ